jgi:hypothetical protein
MGTRSYAFSQQLKGPNISLSNKGMTAACVHSQNSYSSVLTDMSFSAGRHYWEVRLDHYVDVEDIFVGIAKPSVKLNAHAVETPGSSWGWQCTSARKMWPGEGGRATATAYGDYIKIGETVGVLLEFVES